MQKTIGWLAGSFALILLLLILSFIILQQNKDAAAGRKRGFETLNNAQILLTTLTDAETGQRDYLITGDEDYLEPYLAAPASFAGQLLELRRQVQGNPAQLHRLDVITSLIEARLAMAKRNVDMRRNQNMGGVMKQLRTGRDKQLMIQIRTEMNEFFGAEHIKLEQEDARFQSSLRNLLLTIVAVSGLVLLISICAVYWIRRAIMVQVAGAIVQAKERYARSLIETSLDPLVTINAEGKIMDVNLATENVTGVTRDQLTGSDFSDYFTEPEQARASYKQVFSQGYVSDYPLAIRHVSGKVTEVLYNASVYRNEQGKVAGVFAAARDVTEMKRAVRDVAEMKKIETELRQANADLESFSYSVSHDLRAPLRAIDGFSAILREYYAAQLDVEGQRLFQVVSDNAKKMGKLIEDILFLSRANRHEMLINLIDMKALVQEVWDGLATDRTGRVIDFRLTDLPAACADTSALREVLQNLLGNAIKFTRGREPAIIEMAGYVEGKENIYFVRDNGVGFDMAYANKLFGLFQRLHSMTEFEGTGVGLAIVKRFIIKHGGRVWAEGKPGEGATFWFSLPSEINNQRVESVIA